jgi:hypothetical protein
MDGHHFYHYLLTAQVLFKMKVPKGILVSSQWTSKQEDAYTAPVPLQEAHHTQVAKHSE